MGPSYQVFYDSGQHRWQVFQLIAVLIIGFLSVSFGLLIFSIIVNPVLPSLGLPQAKVLPKARSLLHPRRPLHRPNLTKYNLASISAVTKERATTSPVHQSNSLTFAFYVNWDDTSFTSLRQNISSIDHLIVESIHLNGSDGQIVLDDQQKSQLVFDYVKQKKPDLKIMALVNNFNSKTQDWDAEALSRVLENPKASDLLINNLLAYVQANSLAGISIDFENLPLDDRDNLTSFMETLYRRFHPLDLEVSISVPAENNAFDYSSLSDFADYLVLMLYDEHWSTSNPGPISSQKWFEDNLEKRIGEIPNNKVIVAIGNYGYDWQVGKDLANPLTFQDALSISRQSEGEIYFDDSLNPNFDYYDEVNRLHHVWFLDAASAFNEVQAANESQAAGLALWRLGSEDPDLWQVFNNRGRLDRQLVDSLQKMSAGYDLDYEGRGEVLRVERAPSEGQRQLTYAANDKIITDETIKNYPSPYLIKRFGGDQPKLIALTFDDGPDPNYTLKILDILKAKGVKATFFIVGSNGETYPEILKRTYLEGHELGNHTFFHPNIVDISSTQLRIEINSTERLLNSRLGIRTLLFRPPYGEDVEPVTPDQVRPLVETTQLGYYTVGMAIDPNDWRQPGTEQIVKSISDEAQKGVGNIVLLHDGGGARDQTVQALPQIIDSLQAAGFRLVLVSDLLGVPKQQVMPTLNQAEILLSQVDGLTFAIISVSSHLIYWLFFLSLGLAVIRFGLIILLASLDFWKNRQRLFDPNYLPSVTVVVPAHNEEKVIAKCVRSIFLSDYANLQVIVVDDGSTDATAKIVDEFWGTTTNFKSFRREQGGKFAALNYGIHQSQGEIIVAVDADTSLDPKAIGHLVSHFSNPQVGAVAGNAKVGNRINLLTTWQALEYITSQNLDRRAFELLNSITVVPGAVGAWRKSLIEKVGGFMGDTLAEDADLTLRILKLGYRIEYEARAVAFTEAPDTIGAFLKQRFRWMYGTMQAAWKQIDTLFKPRFWPMGIVALPNIIVFQILFPLISPLLDLLVFISVVNNLWQFSMHPQDFRFDYLELIVFYYSLFLFLEFGSAILAFILEKKEDGKLLIWFFTQRFLYRQLMYYVTIKSILMAIRGAQLGWNKLERKATVGN